MDRSSRRRIRRVDELLSAAKKEREEKRKELHENIVLDAWYHATAVAAIVLSGKPKIDEPLSRAWTRTLQHYGIRDVNKGTEPLSRARTLALQHYGICHVNELTRMKRQVGAAEQLAPMILTLKDVEASGRFTEIFRTAPVWLLNFTCIFADACWLDLDFPDRGGPVLGTKWGRAGYEESLLWPLLPLGTMTDGDPVSDEDARRWPLPLKEAHTNGDNRSQSPSAKFGFMTRSLQRGASA